MGLVALAVAGALLGRNEPGRRPSPAASAMASAEPARRALDALAEAEALRKQGELDEAESRAAAHQDHSDAHVRAIARGIIARVHLRRGRAREAMEGLQRAAALHREAARPAEALRDELALVYACLYQGRRFGDARAALGRAEALAASAPDGIHGVRYFQGLLAYETGNLRTALVSLRAALASREYRTSTLQVLAFVLQLLDREDEADALLSEAERSAEAEDPCPRADLLANVGWFRVRSRRGSSGAAELLDRTLELRRERCPGDPARARVLADYAALHVREGRDAEARSRLEHARAAAPDPDGAMLATWLDLEGQLALRAGAPSEALSRFERLAEIADAGLLPVAVWRAALGRARALESLGRVDEAGAAFEQAEAMVARSSLLVPADEGRAGYLGSLDESARAAVRFFAARDPARAAAIARRARARALSSLRWLDRLAELRGDERARWDAAMTAYRAGRSALEAAAGDYWKLTAPELAEAARAQREAQLRLTLELDRTIASLFGNALPGAGALPEPGPGELLLVYHPAESGLVGLAVTRDGAAAREIAAVDPSAAPEALAAALLEPFRGEITAAERVRFLVPGAFEAIDLHALPWDGAPLLAARPVVFGSDVGPPPGNRPYSVEGSALVVADPRGDLPSAREEATQVTAALQRAGHRATVLLGEAATHEAVLRALESAPPALLSYAGHAERGGSEGWDSRLRLAAGSGLTAGDVLALRGAPRLVVLSGCETGATSSRAGAVGLSLAAAFLVAGADAVIAASRPIEDVLAARLSAALHDGGAITDLSSEALARRLREAQLAARSTSPEADWAALRMIVP